MARSPLGETEQRQGSGAEHVGDGERIPKGGGHSTAGHGQESSRDPRSGLYCECVVQAEPHPPMEYEPLPARCLCTLHLCTELGSSTRRPCSCQSVMASPMYIRPVLPISTRRIFVNVPAFQRERAAQQSSRLQALGTTRLYPYLERASDIACVQSPYFWKPLAFSPAVIYPWAIAYQSMADICRAR